MSTVSWCIVFFFLGIFTESTLRNIKKRKEDKEKKHDDWWETASVEEDDFFNTKTESTIKTRVVSKKKRDEEIDKLVNAIIKGNRGAIKLLHKIVSNR